MRGFKRFLVTLVVLISIIALCLASGFIVGKKIYKEMRKSYTDELICESYETKKYNYEKLKKIVSESIQEGVGIDTRKISNSETHYRIYNDNERIIFYCYLKGDWNVSRTPLYYVLVTLTDEYEIIREQYSIKMESINEYTKSYKSNMTNAAFFYGAISMMMLICICLTIISCIKHIKQRKRYEKISKNN